MSFYDSLALEVSLSHVVLALKNGMALQNR